MGLILLTFAASIEGISFQNMRCYTNKDMSTRASVQCGTGYSCLKVTQPSQVFTKDGSYVMPEQRRGDRTVYRGCFVLDIHKDVCNNSAKYYISTVLLLLLVLHQLFT